MSALLNYKLEGNGNPVIVIHGLFGNLDNLGSLTRNLKNNYKTISIDMRNHGQSFHSTEHSYPSMAEDIIQLATHLNLSDIRFIGHSMGGKAAMKVAALRPDLIHSLVILDIAPVAYPNRRHDDVFAGLKATQNVRLTSRNEALTILRQHIDTDSVCQFLAKSLYRNKTTATYQWRFNIDALYHNYANILGWETQPPVDIPTLFIKGGQSEYILPEYRESVIAQFPQTKAHILANTSHWLHSEKPDDVLKIIHKFFDSHA